MDNKKFLTVEEVAAEFGIDEAALQSFVDSGDVRALADRGIWKYRRDELQSLIDRGQIAPPTAEIWLDEASSNDPVLTVGSDADDDLSYIELDEEALAEHATMDSKKSPFEDRTPVEEINTPEGWFVPSDAREMRSEPTDASQSASDVRVDTGEIGDDEGRARSLQSSDSDVRLVDEVILSDSVLDWDETSEKSDSDVRLAGAATGLVGSAGRGAAEFLSDSDSDSDVRIAPSMSDSDSDVRIASSSADSDSDVKIADSEPAAVSDNSGILLDFDIGAGATVSASGSSLRLPQTAGMNARFSDQDADELDSGIWSESAALGGLDDDSDVTLSDAPSGSDSGSALRLGADDSGISLFGLEESGIALEGGSQLGTHSAGSAVMTGGSSGSRGGLGDDSGLSLAAADDSGLALESPQEDSGLALMSAGASASVMDDDSGITLGLDDSGLSLESAGDSGISLTSLDKTLSEGDFTSSLLDGDAGRTQTLNISSPFDDDSSFDMNMSDAGVTSELQIGDEEDDFAETSATVVKKGRGKEGPGLTEAFRLDDSLEVEDLDIADDLEAGIAVEDDEEVAEIEDEEVFDASEETFSDEVDAVEGDDDGAGYITTAAGAAAAAKALGPREPAWGMGMSVGLIAGSLLLAANGLVLWAGVSTMWSGADPTGPAASLISQLAGMF